MISLPYNGLCLKGKTSYEPDGNPVHVLAHGIELNRAQ